MAGGGHGGHAPVKVDNAVEAWGSMRENVYKTFKFTPRTSRLSLIWAVAVPVTAYFALQGQDLKWDWQGKKRADSLLTHPPAPQEGSGSE